MVALAVNGRELVREPQYVFPSTDATPDPVTGEFPEKVPVVEPAVPTSATSPDGRAAGDRRRSRSRSSWAIRPATSRLAWTADSMPYAPSISDDGRNSLAGVDPLGRLRDRRPVRDRVVALTGGRAARRCATWACRWRVATADAVPAASAGIHLGAGRVCGARVPWCRSRCCRLPPRSLGRIDGPAGPRGRHRRRRDLRGRGGDRRRRPRCRSRPTRSSRWRRGPSRPGSRPFRGSSRPDPPSAGALRSSAVPGTEATASGRLLHSTELAIAGDAGRGAGDLDVAPYALPVPALDRARSRLAGRFTVRPLARLASRAQLQRDLVVAATEAERARVAADIHDDALQELTLLVRRLDAAGDAEGADIAAASRTGCARSAATSGCRSSTTSAWVRRSTGSCCGSSGSPAARSASSAPTGRGRRPTWSSRSSGSPRRRSRTPSSTASRRSSSATGPPTAAASLSIDDAGTGHRRRTPATRAERDGPLRAAQHAAAGGGRSARSSTSGAGRRAARTSSSSGGRRDGRGGTARRRPSASRSSTTTRSSARGRRPCSAQQPGLEVVGTAGSLEEARTPCSRPTAIDVVLLDIRLGTDSGLSLLPDDGARPAIARAPRSWS